MSVLFGFNSSRARAFNKNVKNFKRAEIVDLFSEVVEFKGVLTGQLWALSQNSASNLQKVILCSIRNC